LVTPEDLINYLDEMYSSINILMKKGLFSPSLILTYSLIDIMAWLNRPPKSEDVQQLDFIQWSEKYLQPIINLKCTSLELYGARCGMVHSYNSESGLSRKKIARKIYYAFDNAQEIFLQRYIEINEIDKDIIVVNIEKLVSCLLEGMKAFFTERGKEQLILKRAEKFLRKMPASWIT